jgi:4-amino-4-deoxy-L-arabinose transferase-like glycosyltransferase
MNKFQKIILVLLISLACILRFPQLDKVPPSLHADEAAEGFNAYSLLTTGKDMYGKSFPLLFRANGSYQPPIYTYISIIPTAIFGNSMITIRLLSALSGVILVYLTYLVVSRCGPSSKKERVIMGLIASGVVAISPWAIHFSRLAAEANLGVLVFALGVLLVIKSLSRISLFPLATFILGFSTHTYYTERVVVVLLLVWILIWYRKYFLKNLKTSVFGLIVFGLTLLPHLYLLTTGALTKRLAQVSYLGVASQGKEGFLSNHWNMISQFLNHYLIYYSPKNLFFDPGTKLGITTTDIGVFYPWLLIPLLIGLGYLVKNRKNDLVKFIFVLLMIAPIPAGLTGDLFYPLRTLDYLWILTLVISFGCYVLIKAIKNNILKVLVIIGLATYSLLAFGISYFVLFKYEETSTSGEAYIRLIPKLEEYKDKRIIVDYSSRAWGVGIRTAYLAKADPRTIQDILISQQKTTYYSGDVNAQEIFIVRNTTFEPLNWNKVCGKDVIFVGDMWSFDPTTLGEHGLKLEFTVDDYLNQPVLFGYSSNMICK